MDDAALIENITRNPVAALIGLAFAFVVIITRKEVARMLAAIGSESALETLMHKNLLYFEALSKQAGIWVEKQSETNRHLERHIELQKELIGIQTRVLEEMFRENGANHRRGQ